jgi:hypothetical protein
MFVVVVTHGAGDPQNPPSLVSAVYGPFCSKIQAQEWIDARNFPSPEWVTIRHLSPSNE